MQAAGFSGAGDFASPEVQAIGLFAMDAQFLEAFLQPLPVLLVFPFGECGGLRVFLGVALEDARADEVGSIVYGMHQGSGIVQDELVGDDGVFKPSHEMFGRWGGWDVRLRWCRFRLLG